MVDFGVRCGTNQPVVGSVQVSGQVHIVFDLEIDVDAQVVEQALADPGGFVDDGDPHLLEMLPRADPREHQQLR